MTMAVEDFLSALVSEVPEAKPIVREHLEVYDELLLHLLTADLRRYAIDIFASEQSDVLRRLLGVIDHALLLGNDFVSNAIAVSFVEDSGWWDPAMQPFIASCHWACRPRRAGNGNLDFHRRPLIGNVRCLLGSCGGPGPPGAGVPRMGW